MPATSSRRGGPTTAEHRDGKKARAATLANFTGVGSFYEPPMSPDIHIDTTAVAPELARIVDRLLGTD